MLLKKNSPSKRKSVYSLKCLQHTIILKDTLIKYGCTVQNTCESVFLVCGERQSGKSYLVRSMLHHLNELFDPLPTKIESMIYPLGLVNTKQREFFFVSSTFVLLLAYASTMFLCLSLCRSCLSFVCPYALSLCLCLFVLMLMPLV